MTLTITYKKLRDISILVFFTILLRSAENESFLYIFIVNELIFRDASPKRTKW